MTMNPLGDALKQALNVPWTGFVALKHLERRQAKNGSTFFRVILSDGQNGVGTNIYDDRPWFQPLSQHEWRVGDHFKVQGKVSLHPQFGRQIEIAQLRPVEQRDARDGYRPELLTECAPVDLEAYWSEVERIIASLEPRPLRDTVADLFAEHGATFRQAAAAKQAHHAYRGGLLQHTVSMAREARALMDVPDFPDMNRSLVLAGILLHDLGKTVEMELYPRSEYTELGALVGHTQIVLGWLETAARSRAFEGPLLVHLKHIILSHHGQHEFGAAMLPQTIEALFVHLIDNLDSKMQMIRNALQRTDKNESLTEKLWALDNRAFRRTPAPDFYPDAGPGAVAPSSGATPAVSPNLSGSSPTGGVPCAAEPLANPIPHPGPVAFAPEDLFGGAGHPPERSGHPENER